MKNPPDINCTDLLGNTPLHCAAYRGQKQCAVKLLQHKANPNIKNKSGNELHRTVASFFKHCCVVCLVSIFSIRCTTVLLFSLFYFCYCHSRIFYYFSASRNEYDRNMTLFFWVIKLNNRAWFFIYFLFEWPDFLWWPEICWYNFWILFCICFQIRLFLIWLTMQTWSRSLLEMLWK